MKIDYIKKVLHALSWGRQPEAADVTAALDQHNARMHQDSVLTYSYEDLVGFILGASKHQPMYNGRPSCPFCYEFIDSESTHHPQCVVTKLQKSL